jgi:hypothetical protein
MARTEITVAKGVVNSDALMTVKDIQPGATGLSGYFVEDSTFDDRLGLIVTNSGSATGAIEIKASDLYENKGIGDLSVTVGGSVTRLIGPLDGIRFRQSNGDINVDSVGVTGSIYAVEIG